MIRNCIAAALAVACLVGPAGAQDRIKLGYGRMIDNDFIGDTQDRWHSGSVASSRVYGRSWDGQLPESFGEILEFRIGAEIMAPDNLVTPAAGDRPFAGALSLGLHTHYRMNQAEIAMGADMVVTGPVTGLDHFQGALHDLLGMDKASATTRANQIGNGVHPTFVMEVGRTWGLGSMARIRPFVETRVGAETLLRAGADLTFGQVGRGELLVRDPVSGQQYRTIQNNATGYSFVLGADIAKVADSIYLPDSGGYDLTDSRQRVRAGVHWQGQKSSGFYGLTWLGEEFVGQGEGQVVGSLRLNLDF
ncbi:lipid A-modifier LpxR family protein [Thalassovita taeanensis]|uniref:Lipid A deacylase LpxR family protein n=1 Tax=Thalassovita taeanensis TaxID=657014 RepID=A0A1H9I4Y4_9RHOB|nr:lipid A-modifier LpxR family protein [Thalassovita taeanensis]SEQ69613.1 hypothetical protein SAMN04488092_11145 [Thalassovita taeanensis]